jgi:predicted  nucleic acid-binding Zn-ribbon protein
MLPDITQAIRLQILDDRAAELTKEIAALPAHIAEIEKKLDNHQKRLERDRAALAANLKERKRFESEIQVHEQKISKLKTQMMEAKTNDQYRAFQHEIDFCEHEIRSHEDRILESMSESELLDKNVKAAEAELNVEKKQVDLEKAKTRERTAADQKEMDALKLERAKIIALMTPKVAAEYERIRKGRAGVAIAEVIGGRCSKCNMQLRPQFLQELKRGDTIMVCESCKRMLYWNPPQSVEDLAPQGREATTKG